MKPSSLYTSFPLMPFSEFQHNILFSFGGALNSQSLLTKLFMTRARASRGRTFIFQMD